MRKIILKLTKIKSVLFYITLTIVISLSSINVFHDGRFTSGLAHVFVIILLIGAGELGLLGVRAGHKYFVETQEYYDMVTFLIAGVGFLALIVLTVISIVTYYNEKVISITVCIGSIVLGGILRLDK